MIEKRIYARTELTRIEATPEEIISGALDEEVENRMLLVIATEGPIVEELLFKRVINSLSLKKLGARLLPVFVRISSALPVRRTPDRESYVYHSGSDEEFFRPSPDPADRYSYQIPIEEAARCLQYILSQEERTLTRTELLTRFKEEFGYARAGSQVENLFTEASKSDRIRRTGNGRFRAI